MKFSSFICIGIVAISLSVEAGESVAVGTEADFLRYESLYQKAAIAQNMGDYVEAERWHREVLNQIIKLTGIPAYVYIQARYNLASAIYFQGRLDEAEQLLVEAQDILEANPQTSPLIKAYLLVNIGTLKTKQGEFVEAEKTLMKSLSIFEDTVGPRDLGIAEIEIALAKLFAKLGKLKKAVGYYRHALSVFADNGFDDSIPFIREAKSEYQLLVEQLGGQ